MDILYNYKEKISIIIPAYNRADYLLSTIGSIKDQTFKNWECLIVDDFSTDNTKTIVEEFIIHDARFRYLLNERTKGAQGARNTGILYASGEWIAFNDSDDEWMPDKLEKQMDIIESMNYEPFIVIHSNCLVNDHVRNNVYKWELPIVEGRQPFTTLLKSSSPMFQSIITSKKALVAIDFLDEKVLSYQEWDTSIKLSKVCEFVHKQEPLFIYHIHKGETISKDIKRDIAGYQYLRLKYARDFIQYFGEESFSNSLIDNIKRASNNHYWPLGLELLKGVKRFIALNKYWYLVNCFRLHINPNFKKLQQIRKIFSH